MFGAETTTQQPSRSFATGELGQMKGVAGLSNGGSADCTGESYSISITTEGTSVDKYPAKQHARRVATQLQVDNGLIFLMGQRERLLEDSDQEVPFRQRRYFFYLSGVEEADCHVTYDIGHDVLTLYVPDFDLHRAIWMGPTLGREEAACKYDIDQVKYYSEMNGDVERWASEYNDRFPVYIIHQDQKPAINSGELRVDHVSLMPAMDACRVIKDCHEIGLIKRANEISAAAHTAVLMKIGQLTNEAEIEGIFFDTCISNGAHHQAYDIIAAAGENAATLHYTRNNDPLKDQQLILLDAGAEWNCYASDVTRTFPRTPSWPSPEAWDIYQIVLRMQERCIYRIKEGVRFLDLHWLAHDTAISELLDLGIVKGGSVDEIRRSGASRVFFPHGLGHHLGLEVHDVSPEYLLGQRTDDRNSRFFNSAFMPPCTESAPVLKAGMVVTVEPGIYFSRLALEDAKSRPSILQYMDMSVVERYMSVGGVRIEDDILVTRDGFENLTTAPKKIPWLDLIPRE